MTLPLQSSPRLRQVARATVVLVVLGAGSCALLFTLGAERFGVLGQVQYLPLPLFLVPALAAALLSLALGRAWRAAAAGGVALFATTVMGFELNLGEDGSERLRVMTYNVKGYLAQDKPEGFMAIAREIALHDADVIVLQDAAELAVREEKAPGSMRALFAGHAVYAHGEYIVASRYPLQRCEPQELALPERLYSFVHCVVEARGMPLDVVTTHLMSPRPALASERDSDFLVQDEWRRNVARRLVQADAVAAFVGARTGPLIVAGDFNATDGSLVMRRFSALGLRDAFATAGRGYGYTWGHSMRAGFSFVRIDHVLTGSRIGVVRCFVGGKEGSPHRPVIADLVLRRS